jgi:hypothetical protein
VIHQPVAISRLIMLTALILEPQSILIAENMLGEPTKIVAEATAAMQLYTDESLAMDQL